MKQLLFFSVLFIISTNLNSQGWGQTQKIVAQDRHSEQEFACSVAIQGSIAAIGARSDNEAAGAAGAGATGAAGAGACCTWCTGWCAGAAGAGAGGMN